MKKAIVGAMLYLCSTMALAVAAESITLQQHYKNLFDETCAILNYGCDLPLPQVYYAPLKLMQEIACRPACYDEDLRGLWIDGKGAIIMRQDIPPGSLAHDSVFVHELVHYFQYVSGRPEGICPREMQGYDIQDLWLERRDAGVWPRPRAYTFPCR